MIVSDQGGPKEICAHGVSGLVIAGENPADWRDAIVSLLDDARQRRAMAAAAPAQIRRFCLDESFTAFWNEHVKAAGE